MPFIERFLVTFRFFFFILMVRNKFSAMIDEIGLQQPAWKELTTTESALGFASMGESYKFGFALCVSLRLYDSVASEFSCSPLKDSRSRRLAMFMSSLS